MRWHLANPLTPESFIGTVESSPLVTACVISACRFSFSNSMKRVFFDQGVDAGGFARGRRRQVLRLYVRNGRR